MEIFGDGGIWSEALASSPERGYKTSGNLAAGMSASRRDAGGTNAKEEARFLRGESGSIRLLGQPSPRLTHSTPANHEIFCAYISLLLLIANCKYLRKHSYYRHKPQMRNVCDGCPLRISGVLRASVYVENEIDRKISLEKRTVENRLAATSE